MEPAMPVGIYSRAADNWKPLLAIADAAGGEWPQRARDAASKSHAAADVDDASMGELLLADIRDVFASEGEAPVADMFAAKVDVEISSADLVKGLIALEGHPWAELGKARKPLTTNGLARRLKPLGIAPGMTGPESARQRGYKLAAFEEAFSRYLPSEGVSNRTSVQNAANTGTSDDFQPFSQDDGRTVAKCEKPNNDGLPNGRTVAKGGNGDARASSPLDDGVGVSAWRIRGLADEYQDRAYANAQESGGDTRTAECDAWLRQKLANEGVRPEHIEVEFRRVMDVVFRV
jgi:hypothetical protein